MNIGTLKIINDNYYEIILSSIKTNGLCFFFSAFKKNDYFLMEIGEFVILDDKYYKSYNLL